MSHSYSHIDVQGHRGARAVLPENTLTGFGYALEIGVNTLEFDLNVTKDNVVVVCHDQKINPIICQYKDGSAIEGDLWVRDLTLAQIKNIDCGSRPNPRFPNQTLQVASEIPTLSEVFILVKESSLGNAKSVMFNIETKSDELNPNAQPTPEEFVALILEEVSAYGFEQRVTLQSFDHRTLRAAKQQAPDLQLSALFEATPESWIEAALDAHADIVSPYYKLLNRKNVEEMQDEGLAVIPWTANKKRQWNQLIKLGVDGIISDDPEGLIKYLAEQEAKA